MMTEDQREQQAKARFFTLAVARLFGALLVLVGFVVIAGKWDLAGDWNKFVGAAFVLMGAFDFAVLPVLLARHWKRQQ